MPSLTQHASSQRVQRVTFDRDGRVRVMVSLASTQALWFSSVPVQTPDVFPSQFAHPHFLQRRWFRVTMVFFRPRFRLGVGFLVQHFLLQRVHTSTFERAGRMSSLPPLASFHLAWSSGLALHIPLDRPLHSAQPHILHLRTDRRVLRGPTASPTFLRASGPMRQQFFSQRKQLFALERDGRAGSLSPFSASHSCWMPSFASQLVSFGGRRATHTAQPHILHRILER